METTRSAALLRIAREALAKRSSRVDEEGADSGFTLIELMVVLLILAILLAIAIPTFLGVTTNAHDRAAQSNLTNALTTAKANFVSGQSYQVTAGAEVTSLQAAEPSLTFTTSNSTDQNTVSVGVYQQALATAGSPWDVIVLAVYSNPTGHCWWAADVENSATPTLFTATLAPGTRYAETMTVPTAKATDCNANAVNSVGVVPKITFNSYPTTPQTA